MLHEPLAQPIPEARDARLDRVAVEEPLQILGQGARRVVAGRAVLLQTLEGDGLEIRGDVPVQRAR